MSTLLFLTTDDFSLARGANTTNLCQCIPGISLILYYSKNCKFCERLIPIFKKLPGSIGGCQIAMVNIDLHRRLVPLSQNTTTKLEYVPFIVLYVDGKPFMIYNGPHDVTELRQFVFDVASKLTNKQQFVKQTAKPGQRDKIPVYTIGHPKKEIEVCYLEFSKAYVPQSGRK